MGGEGGEVVGRKRAEEALSGLGWGGSRWAGSGWGRVRLWTFLSTSVTPWATLPPPAGVCRAAAGHRRGSGAARPRKGYRGGAGHVLGDKKGNKKISIGFAAMLCTRSYDSERQEEKKVVYF